MKLPSMQFPRPHFAKRIIQSKVPKYDPKTVHLRSFSLSATRKLLCYGGKYTSNSQQTNFIFCSEI